MDRHQSRPPATDFRTLFRYAHWANDRLIGAMKDADGVPERATELLAHLLRARDVWYGRIQDTDHADLNLWVDVGLQACVRRANASDRRWGEVLDGHIPEKLDQPIAYTNSKGHSFRTALEDVLVHVLNHGTHHRGQIALVLREGGIAPPATDYIVFLREQ